MTIHPRFCIKYISANGSKLKAWKRLILMSVLIQCKPQFFIIWGSNTFILNVCPCLFAGHQSFTPDVPSQLEREEKLQMIKTAAQSCCSSGESPMTLSLSSFSSPLQLWLWSKSVVWITATVFVMLSLLLCFFTINSPLQVILLNPNIVISLLRSLIQNKIPV